MAAVVLKVIFLWRRENTGSVLQKKPSCLFTNVQFVQVVRKLTHRLLWYQTIVASWSSHRCLSEAESEIRAFVFHGQIQAGFRILNVHKN